MTDHVCLYQILFLIYVPGNVKEIKRIIKPAIIKITGQQHIEAADEFLCNTVYSGKRVET